MSREARTACQIESTVAAARSQHERTVMWLIQIVYKLTTPFTVGTLSHPVVISNLAIAALHAVTLALIAKGLFARDSMHATT